jgi:hypothetical protein
LVFDDVHAKAFFGTLLCENMDLRRPEKSSSSLEPCPGPLSPPTPSLVADRPRPPGPQLVGQLPSLPARNETTIGTRCPRRAPSSAAVSPIVSPSAHRRTILDRNASAGEGLPPPHPRAQGPALVITQLNGTSFGLGMLKHIM